MKKSGKRKILFYGTFVLCFGAIRQLQYHDLSSGPAVVLAAVKGAALRQGRSSKETSQQRAMISQCLALFLSLALQDRSHCHTGQILDGLVSQLRRRPFQSSP